MPSYRWPSGSARRSRRCTVSSSADPALVPAEAGERRPVGRPPRITRADIAEAALEIGLADTTMKAVAERLGVSVPGLYHHVRNRQELLRLAAERSLSRLALPEDRGQHWATWLREWARYSRRSLLRDAELFNQYLSGAIDPTRMVEVLSGVVAVLERRGFGHAEALDAWESVGTLAVGSVVEVFRQRDAARQGRPGPVELRRALLSAPEAGEVGGAGEVDQAHNLETRFEDELTVLLIGLAVRRGEDWRAVVAPPDGAEGPGGARDRRAG